MEFTPLVNHKIEDIATIIFSLYRLLNDNETVISKKNLVIFCFILQTESITTFKEVSFFDEFYYKNERLFNKKINNQYDFLMKHLNDKNYEYDNLDFGYAEFYMIYIVSIVTGTIRSKNAIKNALEFAKNISIHSERETNDDSGRIDNEVLYDYLMNFRLNMEPDEVDKTIDDVINNKNLPYVEDNIDINESECITERIQ